LAERFGVAVGLSDHTLGSATAVAAACVGACAIEKHITLARADGGPDAGFSLEPSEFAQLARDVRDGWDAMGQAVYERQESEKSNAQFRRSLYAVADIGKGETFTADNVRSIRPGFGLAPKHYEAVLGQRATRDIKRGTPIEWSLVSPAQKS
jgi:N-acetylneuraminate synthase